MKRYTVVEEGNLLEFEQTVAKYLNRGWECAGGVFMHDELDRTIYLQAMVKNVESNI